MTIKPSDTASIRLRRNMELIVGAHRVQDMRERFQKHYIDSLTDEQQNAVLCFSVLPRVFVVWYEMGCVDFMDGLSRLSITTTNPFEPYIVLFLDSSKPFPAYSTRWNFFAGMPMYVKRF